MKKYRKKIILIFILIVFFIGACFVIFNYVKDKNGKVLKEITGTVIVADPAYVIIEAKDKDYLISNIKGNYQVGDKVEFSYFENDLYDDEVPNRIMIQDEELISAFMLDDDSLLEDNNNQIEENKTSEEENIVEKNNIDTNNTNSFNNQNQSNNALNNIDTSADAQVLSYFNELQDDFNSTSIKDSVKNGFITVVDFLFYNGKIKGYTFSELSNYAKLKVLAMALYFDSKIDKYFPGYKESISNTTGKIYTNIKEKIVSAYLTLTTNICANNEELCADAKSGFNELKTNFGLTWDLIKDIAGDGLVNLKKWYEIWSGK